MKRSAAMARWVVMVAGVVLAAIAVRNLFVRDLRSVVLVVGALAAVWLQIRRDPRGPRATFWLGVFAAVAAVYTLVFDRAGGLAIAVAELAVAVVLCIGGVALGGLRPSRPIGNGAD